MTPAKREQRAGSEYKWQKLISQYPLTVGIFGLK
jgi:hypothetical protein